jgi:beta-glucosidase
LPSVFFFFFFTYSLRHLQLIRVCSVSLQWTGEMGGGTYTFFTLEDQVNAGMVDEKMIDKTVETLLLAKFESGLFEDPYPREDWAKYDRTAEAAAVEYQMELESIVLLKNSANVLPIDISSNKTIAVIGPQAAM